MVISYNNSQLQLVDLETNQVTLSTFEGVDSTYDGTPATQINRIIAHKTQSLIITAHEDKHIRFFDYRSGKSVHSMVAHLDAVSTLDVSPNGQVLVTAGA
jgi:striatin 1/3/4